MMIKAYRQKLAQALQELDLDIDFTVLADTSTNLYANTHYPISTPFLIAAISQKDGQGRCGRCFESAAGGAYFTLQLLAGKDFAPDKYTITAAVAVANTLCNLPIKLKWPNDIYIEGKKLGGILCTSKQYADKVLINCGIGININNKVSMRGTAQLGKYTSVWQPPTLIASVVKNFLELLDLHKSEILTLYKQYSNVLGKKIKVISSGGEYIATAKDITSGGILIVEKDGGLQHLFSGDVSLLPVEDTKMLFKEAQTHQ